MAKEDKIKITYNNGEKVIIKNSSGGCLYWKCEAIGFPKFKHGKVIKDNRNTLDGAYCGHPLRKKDEHRLRCRYGLTNITVPDRCPLKNGALETKVELIIKQ